MQRGSLSHALKYCGQAHPQFLARHRTCAISDVARGPAPAPTTSAPRIAPLPPPHRSPTPPPALARGMAAGRKESGRRRRPCTGAWRGTSSGGRRSPLRHAPPREQGKGKGGKEGKGPPPPRTGLPHRRAGRSPAVGRKEAAGAAAQAERGRRCRRRRGRRGERERTGGGG